MTAFFTFSNFENVEHFFFQNLKKGFIVFKFLLFYVSKTLRFIFNIEFSVFCFRLCIIMLRESFTFNDSQITSQILFTRKQLKTVVVWNKMLFLKLSFVSLKCFETEKVQLECSLEFRKDKFFFRIGSEGYIMFWKRKQKGR